MRVVFLYTELAEYFIKCCEVLSETAEVHIVRWPVNKEAPFSFQFSKKLQVYDKQYYDHKQLQELVASIKPDVLVCSGWIDKDYLSVVSKFAGTCATVLTCDTHWKGTLKQWVATLLSRFFLLPRFSHAWVPGEIQFQYVRKLGFKKEKISKGFYSCDLEKFNLAYKNADVEMRAGKKRFLYVGRYYDFKGIEDLWNAFIEFDKKADGSWELWCLGNGDIRPVQHPRIKHFGFVQPSKLEPIIQECSVFILPSRFEPWGVVVHEYAASGFPLILSDEVGASPVFLKNTENGFSFKAGDIVQLEWCLTKISEIGGKALISMSAKSHQLAQQISPAQWAATVKNFYDETKQK